MSYGTAKCLVAIGLIAALATPVLADSTGLAGIHALRKERGKTCMTDHFHFGKSSLYKRKRRAQTDSIGSWRGLVALEYGTDWASYKRAASRSMTCKNSGGMWNCNVEARPCRGT
jgi:hypothetical protein